MVRRINAVRRLRRLPADLAKAAMIGVSLLLPLAVTIGMVAG